MKRSNITHILAATLVVLSASSIAFANPAVKGADSGKWTGKSSAQCQAKRAEMRQKFAKELGLSADQQKKIDVIRSDFMASHKAQFEAKRAQYQELRALKEKGAPQAEIDSKRAALHADFASMKADREKMDAQIKATLTPEQAQKFDTMRAQFHHHHRHHGQEGGSLNQTDKKQ